MRTISGTSRWMLTNDEAKRRIAAARLLRGLGQDELDELGAKDGLGRQELSRTERGELPITKVRRETLARLLAMPAEWFSTDSIDALIRRPSEGPDSEGLARIEERLDVLDALQQAVEAVGERLEDAALRSRINDLFAEDQAREDGGEHGGAEAQQ